MPPAWKRYMSSDSAIGGECSARATPSQGAGDRPRETEMTQFSTPEFASLSGEIALDRQGEEIGTIGAVYVDDDTDEPEWAAVDLGSDIVLLPLAGASAVAGGVRLAYDAEEIEDAPHRRSRLSRVLPAEVESDLYAYYGLRPSPGRRRAQRRSRSPRAQAAGAAKAAASNAVEQGQEVASTAADEAQQVASAAVDQGQQVVSIAAGQGQKVAKAARRQARDVAATARDEAADVTQELSEQARALVEQARSQVQEQAETQSERLAQSLRRLGAELLALVEGRPNEAGTVRDYARQIADKLNNAAEEIESRGPEGLLDDLKAFASERPGAFVLGAAVAGLAVGRLARSAGGDGGGGAARRRPTAGSGGR